MLLEVGAAGLLRMSDYVVHHLNDDGTSGAVIGTAPDVAAARRLGDEQAADPDYPWYQISRAGEQVETAQSFPTEYYDPERDGVPPPVPSPEDRAVWPRPVDRAHYERRREQMKGHQPPL